MLHTDSPYLDYYGAIDTTGKKLFFILLNNDDEPLHTTVQAAYNKVLDKDMIAPQSMYAIDANGKRTRLNSQNDWPLAIPAYGIQVIEISYQ
ncbi:hypothetical protein [Paraflavitalea speifideaquila]|uniref:hypothetical protein n=1 Tax=Paraflavitalea speifideaquila TaxID=3076558 RepID=UPI0028ED40B4|nr:hypothetical protein [Paraflavitalea speifideiaquila]